MGWLGRSVLALFVVLVAAPVLLLLIFRIAPVPGTPQMLWSLAKGAPARITAGPMMFPPFSARP